MLQARKHRPTLNASQVTIAGTFSLGNLLTNSGL